MPATRARTAWSIFWPTRRNRFSICCRAAIPASLCPSSQVALNVLGEDRAGRPRPRTRSPESPPGFIDLDYRTSGFQPSDLILIAARPSMGKTAFVLNVVEHVAVKKELPLHGVQSGDVQGAAGQPYALHGVQRGLPEAAHRKSRPTRTGTRSSRAWEPSETRSF